MSAGAVAFQIEKILDETIIDDKPHYLVKWKGYCSTQSTWEPIENLIDTLDIVHAWKLKNNPNCIRKQKLGLMDGLQKTKKIGGKQHQIRDKLLQDKLNSQTKGEKRKKHLKIDEEDILSIESSNHQDKDADEADQQEYSFGQCERTPRKTRSKSQKKFVQQKQIGNSFASSKFHNTSSGNDVNGYKIIGKVTKEGVHSVLWCFDWEDKKICQVQLKDGRKVNMKREDLKKICPDKLCEYYEKLEKTKF